MDSANVPVLAIEPGALVFVVFMIVALIWVMSRILLPREKKDREINWGSARLEYEASRWNPRRKDNR